MTDSPYCKTMLASVQQRLRCATLSDCVVVPRPGPSRITPRRLPADSQPPRRRFVRDGEVPVTVIRRDHQPDAEHGINQLDTARQAVRSEAMARERAERSLEEAQITIRDLQTELAHERLARDEAMEAAERAETGEQAAQQTLQSIQEELVAHRLALRNTEDALADAQEGRAQVLSCPAGSEAVVKVTWSS